MRLGSEIGVRGPDALPIDEIVRASRRHLLTQPPPALIPATTRLLQQARDRGLPCAIASSTTQILIQHHLNTLGITGWFTTVVTTESVPRGKPAPDAYLEAARRLRIPPEQCLAIDDAADGIAAALAAGMRTLTLHDGQLVPAPALTTFLDRP